MKRAYITAVWSPAGGVGITSVSLAYAARKVADGKQVFYLNFEPFSSIPLYFAESGKSISAVFEMLEANEGDIKMLIRGICRQDIGGISYLCRPENFDDMNILSAEDVAVFLTACSDITDELIVDLPSVCDARTRQVFEMADRVLLVTDQSGAARIKLSQFAAQHNIFEHIKGKATLVANKGAVISEPLLSDVIHLPLVQTADASAVYKTLSGNAFK